MNQTEDEIKSDTSEVRETMQRNLPVGLGVLIIFGVVYGLWIGSWIVPAAVIGLEVLLMIPMYIWGERAVRTVFSLLKWFILTILLVITGLVLFLVGFAFYSEGIVTGIIWLIMSALLLTAVAIALVLIFLPIILPLASLRSGEVTKYFWPII